MFFRYLHLPIPRATVRLRRILRVFYFSVLYFCFFPKLMPLEQSPDVKGPLIILILLLYYKSYEKANQERFTCYIVTQHYRVAWDV